MIFHASFIAMVFPPPPSKSFLWWTSEVPTLLSLGFMLRLQSSKMRTFLTFATLMAAAATCASAGSLPQFPVDWDAIVVMHLAINQGGVEQKDGSKCTDCQLGSTTISEENNALLVNSLQLYVALL